MFVSDRHCFFTIVLIEKIVSEGNMKHEARKVSQLLANGGCATIAAVLYWITKQQIFLVAFVASITEALCDSAASAVGMRIKGKGICNFSVLEPGLSGGVSIAGSLSCILCATYMGVLAILFKVTNILFLSVRHKYVFP